MSNEIMQETTPLVECSAFHRGMSVLEASLRNTEDSEAKVTISFAQEANPTLSSLVRNTLLDAYLRKNGLYSEEQPA